jgi:hypothetical protein
MRYINTIGRISKEQKPEHSAAADVGNASARFSKTTRSYRVQEIEWSFFLAQLAPEVAS